VAAVVIFLVASNPKPGTVVVGGAAILVLLFSNIRLRKVRRTELEQLAGGTEEMIEQSITRVETTLRHHRTGMIGIVPAVLVGVLVAYVTQGRALFPASGSWSLVRSSLALLGIAVIAGGMLFSSRAIRRGRKELERLEAMRDAYRRERESTAP
jgi:hypothetical protein